MTTVSIREQIEEVEREIELRVGVYARQIASGKMRVSIADYHMNRMRSVLRTLTKLQNQKAEWLKDFLSE